MRWRNLCVVGLGLAAGACAHAASPLVVAAPVPCHARLGPEPQWPDTDAALRAAPDLFERVRLLAAGRLLRMARAREVEAALAACGDGS